MKSPVLVLQLQFLNGHFATWTVTLPYKVEWKGKNTRVKRQGDQESYFSLNYSLIVLIRS